MRSVLLRQARLLSASRVAARSLSQPLARAPSTPISSWKTASAPFRPSWTTVRFNSATAAEVQSDATFSGPITEFAALGQVGVHESVVKALTETLGYKDMTQVQSMTITPALAGKDLVAQAKTGTGKTLAFLIPAVQRIIAQEPHLSRPSRRTDATNIRAIVISPTRELAEQIAAEARKLTEGTGIRVQCAVGGTQKWDMLRRTKAQGCHILVATPGRLNDLLSDERAEIAAPNLQTLVLDEADRMLEVGFEQELSDILRNLPDPHQVPRQTMLFSATIPKNVVQLARSYVNPQNFEFVQTIKADEAPTHEKVPQYVVPVKGFENIYPTLLELFKKETEKGDSFKAIVFLPTTHMVQLTNSVFMKLRKMHADLPYMGVIHSKLTQGRRTQASDDFRRRDSGILFSSDVTARGMDFPNVTHVVQVNLPPNQEQYIHRLGRTGRAGRVGQGWLILADRELPLARTMLPGLPISRYTDFESSTLDLSQVTGINAPDYVRDVSSVMREVDEEDLTNAYMSYLGGGGKALDKYDMAEILKDWTRFGWGWDQPPELDHDTAAKRGLLRVPGFNIGQPRARGGSGYSRGGSSRDFGHGRDGGFSRGPPRDRFDAMQRGAPQDSRRGGGDRPRRAAPSF